MGTHQFDTTLRWTGNDGRGTAPKDFGRDGELEAEGRPTLPTLPPSAFAGGEGGWSPEHLLVGAVSQCHMLWYLHLCQRNGVVVEDYVDHASGELEVTGSKAGWPRSPSGPRSASPPATRRRRRNSSPPPASCVTSPAR